MARHNISSFSNDYVCSSCGNVVNSFSKMWNSSKKFSRESMFCSNCGRDSEFIKLGDKNLVQSDLESYDYDDLDDVEKEVLDLLKGFKKK